MSPMHGLWPNFNLLRAEQIECAILAAMFCTFCLYNHRTPVHALAGGAMCSITTITTTAT